MDLSSPQPSVVWAGQPAWSTYVLLWIFSAIFMIRAVISLWMGYWASAGFHVLVVAVLIGLVSFLRNTTRYRITREAVYRTQGFLGKAEQSFPLSVIESVSKQQGPLERMLGVGNVILHFKNGIYERLTGVKDPEIVCNKIRAML